MQQHGRKTEKHGIFLGTDRTQEFIKAPMLEKRGS